MRGANDNAEDAGGGPFLASARALALPVIATALAYGLPLGALLLAGRGDGAIARLCMVALGLALPFLVAYAVLRRTTARVDVLPHALILHPGFPSIRQSVMPYGSIQSLDVKRGLGGRLSGSATLVVGLVGGGMRSVVGLSDAEGAREAIAIRLAPPKAVTAPDANDDFAGTARILTG